MITKPSLTELLQGLVANLEKISAENPASVGSAMTASLTALDRLQSESELHFPHLAEENADIRSTLADLGIAIGGGLVDNDASANSVSRLEAENRALKQAVVEALVQFDLPASEGASAEQKTADEKLLAVILRILHREDRVPTKQPRIATTDGNPEKAGMTGEEVLTALTGFLAEELPGARDIEITNLQPLLGGASREAWIFDVTWTDEQGGHAEPCIMLREPVGSLLVSDAAPDDLTGTRRTVETEIATIRAMDAAGVPVAGILWADTSGKWLERPFFVSKRLKGTADVTTIVGTEDAPKIFQQYVATLAQIHTLDPADLNLPQLGKVTPDQAAITQVELFERNYREQANEPFPAVEYMIRWLKKNQPEPTGVSIIHGDYRLGNFMFEDGQITGIIDWEQVHLGDPTEEIAFMYWALWSLQALCPIDQFVQLYQQATGKVIDETTLAYYRVFIELKMFVVGLTGMASFYATPEFQIFYGGGTYIKYIRDGQIRSLEEFARGGPTVAFDAFEPKPFV